MRAKQQGRAVTGPASLTFLGGAGTVTGSKYLVELRGSRLLVDCGLFQGFKQLRLRNWDPFPVEPRSIDAVVLTHAHLDHTGYLPLLVRNGFRGPIYCTPPTLDLSALILPDSGHLQEKDADFANRHGFSKHKPALPLYTQADAERSLRQFRTLDFGREHEILPSVTIRYRLAGHILGAASVELVHDGVRTVFSGDIGRFDSPTMPDPETLPLADHLLVESTYGNRRHDPKSPEDALAEVITRTSARGGTVLIPSFAVGRAQALLFHLQRLKAARRIPDLPVFLDSPMAQDASDILCRYPGLTRLSEGECRAACGVARYVRDVEESKSLDVTPMPKVIISASGMATGGRVLHHLKVFAPDRRNTILFSGFQAGGTRGAAMVAGAEAVKIHGSYIPVRAEIANLPMLSAHADADELLRWLKGFERPPKATWVVHGEPEASDTLRHRIEEELGWPCRVAEHGGRAVLS
ncbi:MBL fold metallo-hydrolase [Falsiroseomonas bella]|uniref:MBL fold metallo-hydrolase n=1 Tax=Falsiroseomonas bella TaxID=2184016 RepID=A0A317F8L9_9PROT|nr:MBL fold metallo-hydrolase [Falsiroseomonas bella]PWS34367.1 MBL fold metallo-hydrolase [Falsiroseomonas bella]